MEEPTIKALAQDVHEMAERLPRTGRPWAELTSAEREEFEKAALWLVTERKGDVLGATLEEHDARA